MIELGGNIVLVGFKELEVPDLVVAKKLVGHYARSITDKKGDYDRLSISLKPVHSGEKFEIKVKLDMDSKSYNTDCIENNLFIALDTCLKKILSQLGIR